MVSKRLLFISCLLIGSLLVTLVPSPANEPDVATAQGTVEDVVLALVYRNLGISPAPTRGQVESGGADLAFPTSFRSQALDLNATQGRIACDSPIVPDDQRVVGWYGFRVEVTVVGRRYVYRTNGSGNDLIRCINGQQVDLNFGSVPGFGATRNGYDVTNLAMRHLSGYLDLDVVLTREDVDRTGEDADFEYPYRVFYRWASVVYTNSAFQCPARGQLFTDGPTAAYRILITVNGRTYQYRASPDGSVLLLCLGGGAEESSPGIRFDTTTTSEVDS